MTTIRSHGACSGGRFKNRAGPIESRIDQVPLGIIDRNDVGAGGSGSHTRLVHRSGSKEPGSLRSAAIRSSRSLPGRAVRWPSDRTWSGERTVARTR